MPLNGYWNKYYYEDFLDAAKANGCKKVLKLGLIAVIFILAFFVIFFWMAFEQAGASLTVFADRQTDRDLLGWTMPASWFQSVNAVAIVLFAPVFAWLWVRMGSRQPSSPAKFALGLIFVGLGFAVMIAASNSNARFSEMPYPKNKRPSCAR